ncbi:MAG TPA: hypothetical protein VFI44_01695 [Ornithinibacter sp.]|nr:hypothetical protein [Ornithinibacter sp.]
MSATLGWSDALWLAGHRTPNDRLRLWGSVVSAAMTAALVCTAAGLVALGPVDVQSTLGVVAEPGTRVGVVIAVVLVALPALLLTGQTWRLGSVERRRRLRQMRDAGAGPGELRRVVVADTAVPVAVGAGLGVLLLGVGIALLNLRGSWVPLYRDPGDGTLVPTRDRGLVRELAVLPNIVVTSWWPPLLAVALVTALAAWVASRSVRHLDRSGRARSTLVGRVASLVACRTRRPALLLALRRLAQEPRATTRPALLLGLAAFVAGVSTWLAVQFRASMGQRWADEPYWSQSFGLLRGATILGVGLCALGLVVALTDAVLRRRRADAVAVAGGVPLGVLRRALVLQALLPTVLPVTLGLALGGAFGVLLTGPRAGIDGPVQPGGAMEGPLVPLPWAAWAGWGLGILVVAALAALLASTALARTTRVDQLRVPA